jgi:outer membrane autotransporter protein
MSGLTTGIRQDIQRRGSIGALLGVDDGSIEGGLIDTDASGVAVGVFGSYVLDEKRSTTVSASLSRGVYEFDAQRQSFQGPVMENEIDSHAWELAVGVRTLAYEKRDLRISPYATLRYLNGQVDGFAESGAGVALQVGSQDIESLILDLGVEAEYKLLDRLTLFGALSYVTDFQDSSENITSSFVASGPLGRQFAVSAPGVDDEAIALSLGLGYDITDAVRVNLNYRGDLRFDSQDAHSIGLGLSFGF